MTMARRWAIITLILLAAALTRSWNIAEQSFWVDEGYAFYHARFPHLVESLARDTHPPLYFAALRLWSEIAGQSELALRWFSFLPSMLSLALMAQLAREFARERARFKPELRATVPILALLTLALADAENFLAQEARHYTWLALLVSASMLFFLRGVRRGAARDWRGFVFASSVMLYTHYISAFVLAAQGVYALVWLGGARRRRALVCLGSSALALLPWLLLIGWRQLGNRGANWSIELTGATLADIITRYFSGQWALVIGLIALGCVAIVHVDSRRFRIVGDRTTPLLLLWLLLPFALTVLVNELLPFLQPRRLTAWTPAIALLAALGLANIRMPIRALFIGVLVVYGFGQVDFYRVKPDWRRVARMTARYAVPGQLALTDIAGGDYQMAYYLRRATPEGLLLDSETRYESLKIQRDFYSAEYEAWLPALLDAHDTVWLMYWSSDQSAFSWLDRLGFQRSADFVHSHDGGVEGRVAMHVYRYDRLGDEKSVAAFADGFVLRGAELDRDDLRLDTLWSATQRPRRDVVVSAKLLDASGAVAAQHDGPPQLGQRPSSAWRAGELVYSPHEMSALKPLAPGDYRVIVQLYYWEAGQIVIVPTEAGEDYASVGSARLD